jgi:hypothetical protein
MSHGRRVGREGLLPHPKLPVFSITYRATPPATSRIGLVMCFLFRREVPFVLGRYFATLIDNFLHSVTLFVYWGCQITPALRL